MQFVLYMLYTLIVSMYMEMIVITLSFIILANYQYSNLSPIIYDVFVMAVLLYFVVFLNAFILMIIRSHKRQGELNWLKEQKGKFEIGHLIVRSERRNRKIDFDDIRYLESLADYVRIFVSDQKNIITKEKISSFEGRLPDNFLRVHRSFIVNKNKIESFSKEEVRIDGQDIPISRTYKNKTLNELSKNENAGELSGH